MIRQLAEQLNIHPEALRNWIRQDEAGSGQRTDRPTTDMIEENRRLKRENAAPLPMRAVTACRRFRIEPYRLHPAQQSGRSNGQSPGSRLGVAVVHR